MNPPTINILPSYSAAQAIWNCGKTTPAASLQVPLDTSYNSIVVGQSVPRDASPVTPPATAKWVGEYLNMTWKDLSVVIGPDDSHCHWDCCERSKIFVVFSDISDRSVPPDTINLNIFKF